MWQGRSLTERNHAIVGVVQVAQSARFLDGTLAEARNLMIAGTVLTLLGTAVIGWLLVGRALRPISELTAAADHIVATGRLDARITPSGPAASSSDETGTLVRSFNAMLERLQRSFEQQRQLLADTSHELRNPLTAIRANLEIIEGMDGPDALYEVADEAKAEAIRMSRLVNDLLLLARGDTADAVERKPVELVPLLERIADRARLVAPNHVVETSLLEPCWVMGDADRLYQAVWNLMENALRCTPAHGSICLRLRRYEDRAVIQVEDDGPGIAPEHQSRVFERLYRVDAARSRRAGGAGLGLAIVKWIAEAHGGYVTLASVLGEGSTFKIVLPLEERKPRGPTQRASRPERRTVGLAHDDHPSSSERWPGPAGAQSSFGSHSISRTVAFPASTFTSSFGSTPGVVRTVFTA